jgi:hypothetical protein
LLSHFHVVRVGVVEHADNTFTTLPGQVPGKRHEHVLHTVITLAADEEENGQVFLGIAFVDGRISA